MKKKNYIKLFLSVALTIPSLTFAGTLTIGTITPNANVPAGTSISFQITPDLANPGYTINDSAPGSTLSNSNINSNGKFNWNTSVLDIGTHNLTITGSDSYGNRSSINQTLIIGSSTPIQIQDISPGNSIFPGSTNGTLSFNVAAQGYMNPYFSVSDSFWGTSVTSRNTDSTSGRFSWTPTSNDVGVHNLTIRVTTPGGRNDILYQTVTVNGIHIQNNYGDNIKVGSPVMLTITPYGLSSPSYTLGDSLRNNTLSMGILNGNNFNWTPQAQDIGDHVVSINTVDANGNTTRTQLTLHVTSDITAPPTVHNDPLPLPEKYTFTKALNVGSKGTEVTELQKILKTLGFYSGPTSGNYGSLTKSAVIKFQKARKISALGNIGPATRQELNK
ncbi:MAG: peptidoglycan-binding domain-containing protein [bacterium]